MAGISTSSGLLFQVPTRILRDYGKFSLDFKWILEALYASSNQILQVPTRILRDNGKFEVDPQGFICKF